MESRKTKGLERGRWSLFVDRPLFLCLLMCVLFELAATEPKEIDVGPVLGQQASRSEQVAACSGLRA